MTNGSTLTNQQSTHVEETTNVSSADTTKSEKRHEESTLQKNDCVYVGEKRKHDCHALRDKVVNNNAANEDYEPKSKKHRCNAAENITQSARDEKEQSEEQSEEQIDEEQKHNARRPKESAKRWRKRVSPHNRCPRVSRDIIFCALERNELSSMIEIAKRLPNATDIRDRVRTNALRCAINTNQAWIDSVQRAAVRANFAKVYGYEPVTQKIKD